MPATRLPIIGHPFVERVLAEVLDAGFAAVESPIRVEPWERRPHELADALREVRAADDIAAALIAAPHKDKAPPLSDWLSDDARMSGAVNVLVKVDGRLRGYNADMDGMRAGLAAILPKVKGKWPRSAMVLGAGGGAHAAVGVLIGSGFQHVAVLNRHLHRAEALVAHFGRAARHMELRARPWHDAIIEVELSRAELLINASGSGDDSARSPIAAELMPSDRYVLDLVVDHETTALMAAARERGGTAANGQVAFVAAAAATVKAVTGTAPSADALRAALGAGIGVPAEAVPVVGD